MFVYNNNCITALQCVCIQQSGSSDSPFKLKNKLDLGLDLSLKERKGPFPSTSSSSHHLSVCVECLTQEAHLGRASASWPERHPAAPCQDQTWHNGVQTRAQETEEMRSQPHTPGAREATAVCRTGSLSGICWDKVGGSNKCFPVIWTGIQQDSRERYPLRHVVKLGFHPFVFPLLSIVHALIFADERCVQLWHGQMINGGPVWHIPEQEVPPQ